MPECYLWCIVKNRRYDGLRKRQGFENFADLDEVTQDGINVKAGFEQLGADERAIWIREDVNSKEFKKIFKSYRDEV